MSRSTDRFPVNRALTSGDLFRARPKVSMLNLVDALENGCWHNERGEVVDDLRGENRLYKSPMPNGGDMHTFLRHKLVHDLVL